MKQGHNDHQGINSHDVDQHDHSVQENTIMMSSYQYSDSHYEDLRQSHDHLIFIITWTPDILP